MKNIYSILRATLLFALLATTNFYGQSNDKSWALEIGINAVDVYPVGENIPQGDYFDEFFNLTDHWNFGPYLEVSKGLSKNFTFSTRISYNQISKWGQFGGITPSAKVSDLKYYGLDGMINYSFSNKKLQPYVGIGGGYTWVEEGTYNTFSNKNGIDNLVGAGTLNGALGLKYKVSNRTSINLQTRYKHAFKDYLAKHWQHSIGVIFNFSKKEKMPKEEVPVDSDGDGITDAQDSCPNKSGLKAFNGCPDSDGDGIPDHKDKCPNVKGTDNGCPKQEIKKPVVPTKPKEEKHYPFSNSKTVYFDYKSSDLSNDTKATLNMIIKAAKAGHSYRISVEGHTDSVGSDNYNYNLALSRANRVKQYLVSHGLSKTSIVANSSGETKPISDNSTNSGRAKNRRVEVNITGEKNKK